MEDMGNLQSHLRLLFLVFWSARLRRRPPALNLSPLFAPSFLHASLRVRFTPSNMYIRGISHVLASLSQ